MYRFHRASVVRFKYKFDVKFQYVLNVTPDLPNTFEADGCGINYLKIPIADHWSQNLAVHFPQAIRFIGTNTHHC